MIGGLYFVALLVSSTCNAIPAKDVVSAPSVTLASGLIQGTTSSLPSATAAVTQYLGVPFAVSPPERFAPPQAQPSWTTPILATHTKAACIQQFLGGDLGTEEQRLFNNPAPAESEDCLYLNVYVPPGTTKTSKLAVMFWIFGGNLAFGSGVLPYYDGSSFAYNQNVIIVTHNYRTNVFGFPNAPEINTTSQNPGLLDQRFALDWVHNNIGAFGGDPSKVTIFGQSAGGYSVKQLLAIPPSPPSFRAAILQSEGMVNLGSGTANWESLVASLGCGNAQSQLACMRTKDAQAIKAANQQGSYEWPPVANGVTVTSNERDALSSAAIARIPVLIGNDAQDVSVFLYLFGLDNPGASALQLLSKAFPNMNVSALLAAATVVSNLPYDVATYVGTKAGYTCPSSRLAGFLESKGHQVYRYLYNASFPNTQQFPNGGAYHTSEIPEIFGTYPGNNQYGQLSAAEVKLSQYMQTAWANFAKNLSPGQGWVEYGTVGNVQVLGGNNSAAVQPSLSAKVDVDCPAFNLLTNPQTF